MNGLEQRIATALSAYKDREHAQDVPTSGILIDVGWSSLAASAQQQMASPSPTCLADASTFAIAIFLSLSGTADMGPDPLAGAI